MASKRITAGAEPSRARAIAGGQVEALFPARGPIRAFLAGEAPGPRGADRSGIPFWGDRSGRLVYRVLAEAGLAEVPEEAWGCWDGELLRARRLRPKLRGAVLSNALPYCPTEDGLRFCAPSRTELFADENLGRLRGELHRAARRAAGELVVVALGRQAESVLARLKEDGLRFDLHYLPHPSPRALAARQRGASMAALEAAWCARLRMLLGSG